MDDSALKSTKAKIFLGFDGYVDRIMQPIKSRQPGRSVPFETMKEFSEHIARKAGKSCSIDLQQKDEKLGGNMPIVANALAHLGLEAVCVGAMGLPEIEPVFQLMHENCRLLSVSKPGYCDALEFSDGKLMMAANTFIDALDYNQIIRHVPQEDLVRYIEQCDALAFLNWGEMIYSNQIWESIGLHILPRCSFTGRKLLFVDFSDFSKRSHAEVEKLIEILKCYADYFDITVSLNPNEFELFCAFFEMPVEHTDENGLFRSLQERLHCKNLVVHLLESNKFIQDGCVRTVEKEVVREPRIITGGGDNFGAGLLFGLLSGLTMEQAVSLGAALACLYVRDGEHADRQKLIQYFGRTTE